MEKDPDIVYTLRGIAVVIADNFKMSCSPPLIKYWQTLNPGFPQPVIAGANRQAFRRSECLNWVQENIINKRANPIEEADLAERSREAELKIKIHKEEQERLKLEEQRGKLIDRAVARASIQEFGHKFKAVVIGHIERNSPADRREKLIELGVTPEIVAIFTQWDLTRAQETVDLITKEAQKAHKETV